MTQEDPRILELRRVRAKALEGGGEERIKKQKAKGKLTARERVELLLDPAPSMRSSRSSPTRAMR